MTLQRLPLHIVIPSLALCLAGCQPMQEDASDEQVPQGANIVVDSADPALPTSYSSAGCALTEQDTDPLCDWLARSQAVVIGDIISMEMSSSPAPFLNSDGSITRGCDGARKPALVLKLELMEVVSGELEPGDRIDVHVGYGQLLQWQPSIRQAASWDDLYFWYGGKEADSRGGFAAGQRIGVPLTYNEALGHWSNVGERFFSIAEDGTLATQPHQGEVCDGAFVEEFERHTLASLRQAANSCTADSTLIEEHMERWNQNPALYSIGICSPQSPPTNTWQWALQEDARD